MRQGQHPEPWLRLVLVMWQRILAGAKQNCTDRLSAVLLGSELLHSPGGAQGPRLIGMSCKTLGGTETHTAAWTVGTGVCGKGAAALFGYCLAAGRELCLQAEAAENASPGLAPCARSLGGQLRAQSDHGPPAWLSQGAAPLSLVTEVSVQSWSPGLCARLSEPHLEAVCA